MRIEEPIAINYLLYGSNPPRLVFHYVLFSSWEHNHLEKGFIKVGSYADVIKSEDSLFLLFEGYSRAFWQRGNHSQFCRLKARIHWSVDL